MRRWGLLISLFYAAVVLVLLLPALFLGNGWVTAWHTAYGENFWFTSIWAGGLIVGQVLLLLPVDRSVKRLRPRAPAAVTAAGMGAALAALSVAAVVSLMAGIYGDAHWPLGLDEVESTAFTIVVCLSFWCFWAVAFLLYCRRDPARTGNVVGWLVKGSVLELLVAVPAHVVARRRGDCSAPMVTGFGIITGTAVMLMCVGPGVVLLYRQRMLRYRRPRPSEES
jgi:hypothetical protein